MPNLDLDLPGSATSNAGSEKTAGLGILAGLELDRHSIGTESELDRHWIGTGLELERSCIRAGLALGRDWTGTASEFD